MPRASLWYHLATTSSAARTAVMGKHRSCPEIPCSTLLPTWAEGNTEAFQLLSWLSSHSPEGEVKSLQQGWQSPTPTTQKQGRSHPLSLFWEKISTNLIDCTGLQSSVAIKRLLFPSQLNNMSNTKRGRNKKPKLSGQLLVTHSQEKKTPNFTPRASLTKQYFGGR